MKKTAIAVALILLSTSFAGAKKVTGNPMNLTMKTTPATKMQSDSMCHTIIVGDRNPIPNLKPEFETHASTLEVSVTGKNWKPKPANASTTDQWITVYGTPCRQK